MQTNKNDSTEQSTDETAQTTYSKEEVRLMLLQAWRNGFLSSVEGRNAEHCEAPAEMDEWCNKEVDQIIDGTLDYQPSIVEQF